MKLRVREFGEYTGKRPTLILLHGLLGSSVNWSTVARRLADAEHLLVPDLRNHGHSPHHPAMDYQVMSADLAHLIDEHGFDAVRLVGHSMGGKLAMWFALNHPEQVAGLVVVDIAPVAYAHSFDSIFSALKGLDLDTLGDRQQAHDALAASLPDAALRHYLLQNLLRADGRWRWRMNLQGLVDAIDAILDFPTPPAGRTYPGPSLFIHGSESDYLQSAHHQRIFQLFPHARLRVVPGAGHWVYAEQPEAFVSALMPFLTKGGS